MGSWWNIEVGSHAAPVWGKNYVPDELMLLFTDDDLIIDQAKVDALSEYETRSGFAEVGAGPAWWSTRLMHYTVTAGTLRMRLDLQGFSSQWVRDLSTAFYDEGIEGQELFRYWPEGAEIYPNGTAVTAALTTRRGQQAGVRFEPELRSDPDKHFLHEQWGSLKDCFDDPRFSLAVSLSRTRSSTRITLDLTDLVLGGWLTIEEHPHTETRFRMSSTVAASGPVIVVTEGSSDARFLQRSLQLASPDIAHFFEFLDFADYKSPGGTDRVVSLTKGMAAAGVMNRIVAVLDNDTAGNEAAQSLAELNLPPRIVVVNLPTAKYAENYPTLGTEGNSVGNINGTAASIEFMFGDKILCAFDNSFFRFDGTPITNVLKPIKDDLNMAIKEK